MSLPVAAHTLRGRNQLQTHYTTSYIATVSASGHWDMVERPWPSFDWLVPPGRLERPHPAPEAGALSAELWGLAARETRLPSV